MELLVLVLSNGRAVTVSIPHDATLPGQVEVFFYI